MNDDKIKNGIFFSLWRFIPLPRFTITKPSITSPTIGQSNKIPVLPLVAIISEIFLLKLLHKCETKWKLMKFMFPFQFWLMENFLYFNWISAVGLCSCCWPHHIFTLFYLWSFIQVTVSLSRPNHSRTPISPNINTNAKFPFSRKGKFIEKLSFPKIFVRRNYAQKAADEKEEYEISKKNKTPKWQLIDKLV